MPSAVVAILSLFVAEQSSSLQSPSVTQLAKPAFEVASVKPNRSGPTEPQTMSAPPGERVTVINVTLRTLIQFAYRLPPERVVGGPGWIGTDRFDVAARAPAPASVDELRAMMRTLLEERFTLVTHMETRQAEGYTLMLARGDGRLGPNLRTAAADCATPAARETHGAPGPTHPCNPVAGIGRMGGRGLPIERLASIRQEERQPVRSSTRPASPATSTGTSRSRRRRSSRGSTASGSRSSTRMGHRSSPLFRSSSG
jgi:uncharacterized protein (TIGR03435 family)